MRKLVVLLALGLALPPSWHAQGRTPDSARAAACAQRCYEEPVDPELQRTEIVNLEKETVRAIQLNNGTIFRRVYADDFSGTLSHGQPVDRNSLINIVQDSNVHYDSFTVTDVKVRIFQDTAVASSLWTSRGTFKGHHFESQMRSIHVYVNGARGWLVVSGQTTALPPAVEHPL
jgi:ketosteroid isomerase-like protein